MSLPAIALQKYNPLTTIITYDDFDRGACGWLDLTPNFTEPGHMHRATALDKSHWGAPMLSTSTFGLVGTHGSMDGTYSLKLATRPVANPYEEKPAPGSFSHALKRLSMHRTIQRLQMEMWYAYTPEQDRIGLGEKDIRAFGMFFDIQDHEYRWQPGIRYLNSVNGELAQRWQIMQAADVTDKQWAYGREGEWNIRGIDGLWYGERRKDGTADAYSEVPGTHQQLVYNETDDKINWLYLRLLVDFAKREYIEFQSMDRVYSLRAQKPTLTRPYARIEGLLNPIIWLENDTNRRCFLNIDSVVISMD
ncbi:MAG: hypothetical protein LBJ62_02295 [Bifidobacteriaceae bacterium]|jgi:hypothetical protein|nr:hypothetical protein [Bifidobacteriaceae bacterium]